MLINKSSVKRFTLEVAIEYRNGRFTRVSKEFLDYAEGRLKEMIKLHVRSLPSVGKTVK